MCRVIAIANMKGGVAKTTTAANLGIGLAGKGKRVLAVDCDPQGSLTLSLGFRNPSELPYTLGTVLQKVVNEIEIDPGEAILHHEEGMDLLPANKDLRRVEQQLDEVMSMDTEKYHEPTTDAGEYGKADTEKDGGTYSMKQVEVRLKLQDAQPLYSTDPLDDPESAARVMADLLAGLDREYMCVVNLDGKLRPINFNVVSIGDINHTYVPVQNVFKSAILSNAASILAFHNHPPGITKPSGDDLAVTSRLIDAGRLMNIGLEDHIIVGGGNGDLYSFRQHMPELFRDYRAGNTKSWEEILGSYMAESGAYIVENPESRKAAKPAHEAIRGETEAAEPTGTETAGGGGADKAQELAKRIDSFMYGYDREGYEATVTDRTAQAGNMAEDIRAGNAGYLSGFLADVMGQSGSMDEIREAASLLVMLSDYKPLAKVEELEEENLNQIDNVLSNTVPKAEKKKGEKLAEDARTSQEARKKAHGKRKSLKERLAEKRAELEKTRKERQGKERKPAAGLD